MRNDGKGRLSMKTCGNPQPGAPGQESFFQTLNKYTKASLTLFLIAVVVVLLDIIGPVLLANGHDIISSRLPDQLAFPALLSVPFIPILLMIGSILGILAWQTARNNQDGRNEYNTSINTSLRIC